MSVPASKQGFSRPMIYIGEITRISIYLLVIIVSLSILLIHSAKAQDTTPPAPPSGLRIVDNMPNSIIATNIIIAWDANTEPDLAGYNVYHSVNGDTDFSRIAETSSDSTSFTVIGLTPGINSLAVTAFDTSDNESGFSNVVSVVIALVCGDGMVNPEEECDDGNTSPGDGCSDMCLVENGWVCEIPGEPCRQITCGDGMASPEEECDDGNTSPGDGCSDMCLVENGWVCEIPGEPCRQITCGDGMVSPEEECDDGNLENGDGCSSACLVEELPPTVTAVPTLSEWGLIAMAGILGIVGFMVIRRRKVAA